jgi:glycosyltransferase involved in cell wall biosynthesis
MKVCMYTFMEEKCGVAEYSRSLAESLSRKITVETEPIRRGTIDAARRHLNSCDLAHIQHNYEFWGGDFISSSVAFLGFLRQLNVPVVCTLHSVWPPLKPSGLKMKIARSLGIYNYYNHRVFDRACGLIIHTDAQKDTLIQRGFSPENVFVIPAGVPEPLQSDPKRARENRAKWGIEGKTSIGLFGFISRYKSYELAVDALSALPGDYVLVFAGEARSRDDKEYYPHLIKYVENRGLSGRVRVTGFVSDEEQPNMFSAIDLFVVPYSENASISYALNLCLAYSRPTIAADVAMSKRINEKYGCLKLFKAGDVDDLRAKILSLSRDEARRKELSAGCERFRKERNWDTAAAETLNAYEHCLRKWKKKNV